jgi:Tfp pilus assembly PilM family ATPase
MANTRAALGVELVGEEVRLSLVESGPNGLKVLSNQTAGAQDDLARVFRALPRRPSTVTCALSLEHAAIRILSLPPTTDENLERVIALEAESVLPLDSDDLALAYQMLGMTEQSRMEVLVAAARQTQAQAVLRRVNCAPWVSATATVSSIALLNALQQLRGESREGVVAILKVEDRESELLILDRSRVVVAQLIPVGCRTEAPVPEREAVPAGGAAEGGAFASLATAALPWVVTLSQQVRYAAQALSYERSLPVERLLVCGKGATLPGVDWQLSQRLELPVSFLSPVENDPVDGSRFAVAYGCALQAAGAAQVPLNLSAARVSVAREVEQRRQGRISWGALAASVVVAAGLILGAVVQQKQREIEATEGKLKELSGLVAVSAGSPTDLKASALAIGEALETPVTAARALSLLSQRLPPGTWLAELSYNSETSCVMRGYSLDPNGARNAQIALLRQQVFSEVTLDYRTEEELAKVPVWGFQLTCKFPQKEVKGRGLRPR